MKRALALLLCVCLLCGCDSTEEANSAPQPLICEQLRVLIPEGHMELATQMCKSFTDIHPDRRYAIILSEADTEDAIASAMEQPEAADVVFFSSAQLPQLAAFLAAVEVSGANCDDAAQKAASYGGELLAYPCAVDTSILYYDRGKLTEQDLWSCEHILRKNLSGIKTVLAADITDSGFVCPFVLSAAEQMRGECAEPCAELFFALADNSSFSGEYSEHDIKSGFARRSIAAAVSGTLSASAIESSLGKDFGAAALPRFTLSDGIELQPLTMAEYMLVGVRSSSPSAEAAQELAQWFSSGENQLLRLERLGYIPTDITLTGDKELLSRYPAVQAVCTQLEHSMTVSQQQKLMAQQCCKDLGAAVLGKDKAAAAASAQELCALLWQKE
ncbi:MAG: extracellular solute-binding protein [Oscillospiraceae bacterium]